MATAYTPHRALALLAYPIASAVTLTSHRPQSSFTRKRSTALSPH